MWKVNKHEIRRHWKLALLSLPLWLAMWFMLYASLQPRQAVYLNPPDGQVSQMYIPVLPQSGALSDRIEAVKAYQGPL